jgi:hypothetical protein
MSIVTPNHQPPLPSAYVSGESNRDYMTAAMITVFLGWLGIDRFYLGYTWQGVVKLLTFGGLGIWTLYDEIMILTGDLHDTDSKPLRGYMQNKRTAWMIAGVLWLVNAAMGGFSLGVQLILLLLAIS